MCVVLLQATDDDHDDDDIGDNDNDNDKRHPFATSGSSPSPEQQRLVLELRVHGVDHHAAGWAQDHLRKDELQHHSALGLDNEAEDLVGAALCIGLGFARDLRGDAKTTRVSARASLPKRRPAMHLHCPSMGPTSDTSAASRTSISPMSCRTPYGMPNDMVKPLSGTWTVALRMVSSLSAFVIKGSDSMVCLWEGGRPGDAMQNSCNRYHRPRSSSSYPISKPAPLSSVNSPLQCTAEGHAEHSSAWATAAGAAPQTLWPTRGAASRQRRRPRMHAPLR